MVIGQYRSIFAGIIKRPVRLDPGTCAKRRISSLLAEWLERSNGDLVVCFGPERKRISAPKEMGLFYFMGMDMCAKMTMTARKVPSIVGFGVARWCEKKGGRGKHLRWECVYVLQCTVIFLILTPHLMPSHMWQCPGSKTSSRHVFWRALNRQTLMHGFKVTALGRASLHWIVEVGEWKDLRPRWDDLGQWCACVWQPWDGALWHMSALQLCC